MRAKANIVARYDQADSAKKIDIICRNYNNFLGMIDGFTEGLCYLIENEKSCSKKTDHGDLGVRVQSFGRCSDITADQAVEKVITTDAIKACDFSGGVLDGVEQSSEVLKEALILRDMRKHYNLFNKQLAMLSRREQVFFKCYLQREQNIEEIAGEAGIQYESACQRIRRVKKKIKIQMIGFLDGEI